jgi:hypothetical protein
MGNYNICSWCREGFKSHRVEKQGHFKNIYTGEYKFYQFHSMKCLHQFLGSGSHVEVNNQGETKQEENSRIKRTINRENKEKISQYGSLENYEKYQKLLQQEKTKREENIKIITNVVLPIIFIILLFTTLNDISWFSAIILGGALIMDTKFGFVLLMIYSLFYFLF